MYIGIPAKRKGDRKKGILRLEEKLGRELGNG